MSSSLWTHSQRADGRSLADRISYQDHRRRPKSQWPTIEDHARVRATGEVEICQNILQNACPLRLRK